MELVILKALFARPMYGHSIARWIEQLTDGVVQVEAGSLYPALRRLETRGFVVGQQGVSSARRRVREYMITATGRAHLVAQAESWMVSSSAVQRVLVSERYQRPR